MDFQTVLSEFVEYSRPKASYPVYDRFRRQHFQSWQDWPSSQDIEDWHRSLSTTPHHANKGLSMLKACFNWSIRRGRLHGNNPATGIKRHQTVSRETVLTSQEIATLQQCLDLLPKKLAVLLVVLLHTGCRLSEAREMQWTHLNLASGSWLQPKTKNGRPHTTYLSTQARAAIVSLKRESDWVFPGAYEHCWSRAGVEKVWWQVRGSLGLSHIRLHDFRRTLATHLYRATKDEYLVKRAINHVNPSITAVYVRIAFETVAEALQAQADRFEALRVSQPETNQLRLTV